MTMTMAEAAYTVLRDANGGPLHNTDIAQRAIARQLISTRGKTVAQSFVAVMLRDPERRFVNEGRNQWRLASAAEQAASPPPPDARQDASPPQALGEQLRPYVNLVVHLDETPYTPQQIIDRFDRVSPRIANVPTPDADELIGELLLLRLLEPLEGGRYRRWPHLADATLEDMVRYAALTMLVVVDEDTYRLPILTAPFDGQPHPASEWNISEQRLGWYVEAGLVRRNGDGTYQSLPGALEPMNAATPTARTVNTFLEHVQRVRTSEQANPPLEDGPLPLLDANTLDARIAEIQRELLIDRMTILRIYRALIAGQHVILSGPPGTGKTHLARLIPRLLWRDDTATAALELPAEPDISPAAPPIERHRTREGYLADVVTASEDWGIRHVIGGIVPRLVRDGGQRTLVYAISHGSLTRSVLANYDGYNGEQIPATLQRREIDADGKQYRGQWLVIDEFTRAPIDAAFGSLLTTLGGQRSPLMVPVDGGGEQAVALPRDFRIIGTLNSFDRHFLNQISEAMKRRFTFIDVLPPARELADVEQGAVVFRTIARLEQQGFAAMHTDGSSATWDAVLRAERNDSGDARYPLRYTLTYTDSGAEAAITTLWRVLAAVRVYRQLGTAQAESVCTALFTGRSIGMEWQDALDSALADTLADQLQVLARDEQRVLVAFLKDAALPDEFAKAVGTILQELPAQRSRAHKHLLGDLQRDTFPLGERLALPDDGLFARRLRAFAEERGL